MTIEYDGGLPVDKTLRDAIAELNTKVDTLNSKIEAIKNIDGVKKITDTVNVQVSGSSVPITQRIPTQRPGKAITIANAVAITDTNVKFFTLSVNGLLTEDEIRSYTEFKITIYNTHNQTATAKLYTAHKARNAIVDEGVLYNEANNIPANSGKLMLQVVGGGTGANSAIKVVPALKGIHSDLSVSIQFGTAPTSGAIIIIVEMS